MSIKHWMSKISMMNVGANEKRKGIFYNRICYWPHCWNKHGFNNNLTDLKICYICNKKHIFVKN